MALRRVCSAVLRSGTDLGVSNARMFSTTEFLCRRMPNDDINLRRRYKLQKYRSYTRYFKRAQEARNEAVWWKTFRGYMEKEDPEHGVERVDIGLPYTSVPWSEKLKERKKVIMENRKNPELERSARLRTLKIPLDQVQQTWETTSGPFNLQRLADHYGVYRDLFYKATFVPRVWLRIHYGQDDCGRVHFGNQLTPTEAASEPRISWDAEEGSLWTLLLTCPDEHLQDNEAEYLHWLVGNIPGGSLQDGEQLCHYLPPFPARGTGFHRYIYVLFKQDRPIDFQQDARPSPCHSLADRTFKTLEFYKKLQDHMTPAGLAFFQSQWDESVSETFHNTFNMKEPVFKFVRPPVYHPTQVKYPQGKPLRYLDRYRDGEEHTYGIY